MGEITLEYSEPIVGEGVFVSFDTLQLHLLDGQGQSQMDLVGVYSLEIERRSSTLECWVRSVPLPEVTVI